MKFRNPWIDPRIVHLDPAQARAYLARRGWKSLGPAANPILEMFEGPGEGDDTPSVLVPRENDEGPMLQRMIELVGEVAHFEDRFAVDVLNEMLQPAAGSPVNGPAVQQAEKSGVP
jgi:hypothetical protein